MQIRKFLITVFIVFSLSFSFQPVSIYLKEKDGIVLVVNYNFDNFTNEFIKNNETRKFALLVSLTLMCLFKNTVDNIVYNTS